MFAAQRPITRRLRYLATALFICSGLLFGMHLFLEHTAHTPLNENPLLETSAGAWAAGCLLYVCSRLAAATRNQITRSR